MKKKIPTVLEKIEKVGLIEITPLDNGGASIRVNIPLVEEWLTSRTINGKTVSKTLAANINGYLFPEFLRKLVTAESVEDFHLCLIFAQHLANDKNFEKFYNDNILHTVELYLLNQMQNFLQQGGK